MQPPHGAVVQPSDYHPAVETVARAVVAPRGDGMTVEKFLGTIGRGTQEHAGKFATWDALMTMRGARAWRLCCRVLLLLSCAQVRT